MNKKYLFIEGMSTIALDCLYEFSFFYFVSMKLINMKLINQLEFSNFLGWVRSIFRDVKHYKSQLLTYTLLMSNSIFAYLIIIALTTFVSIDT